MLTRFIYSLLYCVTHAIFNLFEGCASYSFITMSKQPSVLAFKALELCNYFTCNRACILKSVTCFLRDTFCFKKSTSPLWEAFLFHRNLYLYTLKGFCITGLHYFTRQGCHVHRLFYCHQHQLSV